MTRARPLAVILIAALTLSCAKNDTMEKTPLPDFDSLWNYQAPAETEAKFRELLPQFEQSADRTRHAELLTQIARTQGLQRRFDDAHATLDEAIPLLEHSAPSAKVRWLLEKGRVHNSSGKPKDAREYFLDAWELGNAHQLEALAIDAAHMMGIVEPPARQLEWSLRALELAERATEPRARNWKGSLYNNIGWSFHELQEYEKALGYFEKGLEFRIEKNQPRETQIARWCVARCLRSLGRIDESLAIQQQLEREIGEAQDGFVYEELGECLLALGRRDEARPWFAKAHAILKNDPWLAESEPDRISRLQAIANE